MPHNTFKNLPACGGMSRAVCLDFRLPGPIVGRAEIGTPPDKCKGGVSSSDLNVRLARRSIGNF
jgi:hypothetical protein